LRFSTTTGGDLDLGDGKSPGMFIAVRPLIGSSLLSLSRVWKEYNVEIAIEVNRFLL
jgi:hypothetical protein